MAIYHFSAQRISRYRDNGTVRSPLACASYRSGERLYDEFENKTFYYEREIQPEAFILTPDNAPEWASNRERLWNEVNGIEKRYDSQLAREINVALPVELSRVEQRNLVEKYCRENFSNKGMVADVTIHHDDICNPHFHVMLTCRPFNADGSWGNKSKKVYIQNENGDFVYNDKGNKKTKHINTTNWEDKETFAQWRENWATKTNEYLAVAGTTERISHLSNKAQGLETLPTIHEGFVAREMNERSERVNENKNIKEYNRTVLELQKFKELKNENDYVASFKRQLSPDEKKQISSIAKELRLFVTPQNIFERQAQLERWKKSVTFTKDSETRIKKLEAIIKEKELLSEAESILESEANRFITKNYSEMQLDKLNKFEKFALIDETHLQNSILNSEEQIICFNEAKELKLEREIFSILKNRFGFVKELEKLAVPLLEKKVWLENKMQFQNELTNKENYKFASEKYPEQFKEYYKVLAKLNDQDKTKILINELYDLEIEKHYSEQQFVNKKLTLEDKETLLMGSEYFKRPVTMEDIQNNSLQRYCLEEQKDILSILGESGFKYNAKVNSELKTKYPDFQYGNLKYMEFFFAEVFNNYEVLAEHNQLTLTTMMYKTRFMNEPEIRKNIEAKIEQFIVERELLRHERNIEYQLDQNVENTLELLGSMFNGILQVSHKDLKTIEQERIIEEQKRKVKRQKYQGLGY